MEQPYKGRATIVDNFTDLQIIIPAKKNWFTIIFMGAWLCGWFMGETFGLVAVAGLLGGHPASLFILFWLIAWTAGGLFAIQTFLWGLIGKEIISVSQGSLAISRKGAIFFKTKVYDLNEVRNIRVQDNNNGFGGFLNGQRNAFPGFNLSGTIKFDYGLKTIQFANSIDEAEASFILQKLKERNMLTEKNYG